MFGDLSFTQIKVANRLAGERPLYGVYGILAGKVRTFGPDLAD